MEEKVLEMLKEIQPSFDFEVDVDFTEQGYLDSFDIITLIAELEDVFSVAISPIEILPENFNSVDNICTLVRKSKKKEL